MLFDPFCKKQMNHCIITRNFRLLLEVTVHSKSWIVIYHVYYYFVPTHILVHFQTRRRNGGLQRQQLIFHMPCLFSLHLLGCTACLRNRLRSSLYHAKDWQNHCKVNNNGRSEANTALKYFFTNEKRKNSICVSERNFPWWSLILNISLNMFHRKILYIVDYFGLNMEMAPRFTEMYATAKYYSTFPPETE